MGEKPKFLKILKAHYFLLGGHTDATFFGWFDRLKCSFWEMWFEQFCLNNPKVVTIYKLKIVKSWEAMKNK